MNKKAADILDAIISKIHRIRRHSPFCNGVMEEIPPEADYITYPTDSVRHRCSKCGEVTIGRSVNATHDNMKILAELAEMLKKELTR